MTAGLASAAAAPPRIELRGVSTRFGVRAGGLAHLKSDLGRHGLLIGGAPNSVGAK